MSDPAHYTRLTPQPIDVIAAWGLSYPLGCAVKYIARAGYKLTEPTSDPNDSAVMDLQKAVSYLQHEIKRRRGTR